MMGRSRSLGTELVATLLLAAVPVHAEGTDTDADYEVSGGYFEATLRPVREGGVDVTAIAVHSVIHATLEPDSGPFSVTAPVVYASVPGIADRVVNLRITDRDGDVELAPEDDPAAAGGYPYYRHWRAMRDVVFPVTITYRSEVEPTSERRGPPFGIHASAGGVSGAGAGFLVLPENVTSTVSRVHWDLRDLPPGTVSISSFGEGAFELEGPPADLMQGWYMAGAVGCYPESGDANGFSAAWLGDFPFDETEEMRWAGEAYAYLGEFFEYLDPPPRYRVFLRMLDEPAPGGGTALVNSFMLSRGQPTPDDARDESPRGTFVHEMVHLWVGGIEGTQGLISWFSEGLTSYYTILLPFLGGFETLDDYGRGVNELAKVYYTNAARNWTADQIAEVGFGNEQARRVPYQRGVLYFADLDAKIRAATGGQENLHSFTREIFGKREEDETFLFDHDKWKELLAAKIGPSAPEDFTDIIINGKTIIPATDAFGPCFERRPTVFADDDGAEFESYEWVRVASVSDKDCRDYLRGNN
jgi:hypothetical protein